MATRFVRVDLSETARDYRPIAVEPGVPMLDHSGASARILFRWLGGMSAEPEWEGDTVSYYVRDDQGGRLEDTICQPASTQELQGALRDEVGRLRQRLNQSRAETPTERTLRKVLLQTFEALVDNPARSDLDSYFFKYRDVLGNLRLIWCWGYERLDHEPAPSVVCTDPNCNLLFVRRPGKSPRCPSCAGMLQARPKRKTNWKIAALALLLLLLLLGGTGWWVMRPAAIVATPAQFTGPVGTQIDCRVMEKGLFRKREITHQAVGITRDPRVARFNQATGSIRLMGVGQTKIEFQYGGRKTELAVVATPSANPDKLVIMPATVDLAVGSTARLKVFGEYQDGTRVDLSEAAEWVPQNDGKVFARGSLVEGLAPGSATIGARYRGGPDSPYVEAAATVNVAKGDFQSIEVGVDPATIDVGLSGKVRVDAVAGDGRRYNLLESSQLTTEISPAYVAALNGTTLQGRRAGGGKLSVSLGNGMTGSGEFTVVMPRPFASVVHPESLDLAVGEIADIAWISPDRSPVHLNCSKAGIVDITADNRLIGRSVGDTEITVNQSGKALGTVAVTVAKCDFQNLFFDPGSQVVEVDGTMHPTAFALVAGSEPLRCAEIAPDFLTADDKPSAEYAAFNAKAFELAGVKPTIHSAPQKLGVRMGNLKAAAPVEVVMAPCRLELAPAGPIDLPLGQMMRLQAVANYGGGRRVQVPSERLKWLSQEKAVPGLELFDNRDAVGAVGALKAGAGPLNVYANYHGQESNRVTFKSVEADPNVKLDIDVDRTLRVAGEPGRVVLTASGPSGDVELVPSLTAFASSDNKVLKVAKTTGLFAAVAPGNSVVTGSHLAAKDPAKKDFHVCDPGKAKVVFDPPNLRVLVNQKAALPLYLVEMDSDGKKEKQRAQLIGQGVGYYIAQPQAVRFYPPILTGLTPAAAFDISGSIPVLQPAFAKVEVADADAKPLRITPSAASPLAPGQAVALKVEQQVGESDVWQEVRPDAVEWNVPPQVLWTPPTATLRPTVVLPPDLKGDAKLDASVSGNAASVVFTLKENGPDAKDAAARLVLDREMIGKLLPVGESQRYSVVVEKDNNREPAADIHWPANFENEYVKWEAPVLTAKKEGYTQFLRAEVAGRSVLWHTTTYRPGELEGGKPIIDEPRPDWVKIFSQQGPKQVQDVRFAVGAVFSDFKVEVHYPDGYTRFVTKKALLRTPEPPGSALLTADHGTMQGLRPGPTKVTAEFQGMSSKDPLEVIVTAEVEADKLAIDPGSPGLRPGETYPLHAVAYRNGRNTGDITGLGNLTWKSSKPDVARMSGSSVIAASLGLSDVTVERKGIVSQPAHVTVSNEIAADLRVEPKVIEMFLGESQQLGSDIRIMRGDLDVSQQATAAPESPGVVQFDPASRTLRAIGVGETPLGITMGDKIVRVSVNVKPHGTELGSTLDVQPSSLILAVGQAARLDATTVMPSGERVSSTAIFKVADPTVVGVDEAIGRVRALQPGKTGVKVFVLGLKPVTVPVEVTNEEITELTANPAVLEMAAGDHAHLQVFGRAATSGLKEMFPQPDLKAVPRKGGAVDVIGGEDVQAKAIGDDTIDVSWRDKLKVAVPVKVAANAISDLQISPSPERTVNAGQAVTYEVSGMRGGNRVVLTPDNGVQLNVTNPAVARVESGTTVAATAAGQTNVVATFAGQKAESILNVTEGVAGVPVIGGVDIVQGGVYDDHGVTHVLGTDTVVGGVKPAGKVVALVFEPPFYRAGVQAIPQTAKLLRQYENGGFDDVSNDPNVHVTDPKSMFAKVEKVEGGWKISPVSPGTTKLTATLADQTASMAIEINGDGAAAGAVVSGQLTGIPTTLSLWSGETQAITTAAVDPGGGQALVPVEVTVKAPEGQGIVSAEGNKITGRSVGDVAVTVSVAGGQSATVNVHVSAADAISINPPEINLQVGQPVAAAVMAKSTDGTEVAVQTALESMDKNVLDADPAQPGQFVARSQGQTQLHAIYRGKEAFAKVSVSGKRFESVHSTHNRIDREHFDMTIEVLAASGEGELEYRVYAEGDANPKENWVPNQPQGDSRKATLRSDQLSYNSGDEYHLVIEARDKNKNVQKYPLTLVRSVTVEQQEQPKDSPQPK